MSSLPLIVKHLGRVDYAPTWQGMQDFTAARGPDTPDEIWLLEHPPVFTLGLAGKREHILQATDIPIVPIDRGGQVTYHGPGQIVAYLSLNHCLGAYHPQRCAAEGGCLRRFFIVKKYPCAWNDLAARAGRSDLMGQVRKMVRKLVRDHFLGLVLQSIFQDSARQA